MKKIITIFLFLVSLFPMKSMAQMTLLRDNGTGFPIMVDGFLDIRGSAYFEEFKKGIIYLGTGQKVEGLSIALNAYNNTLEYKLEGGLFAYTPNKVKGFSYLSDEGNIEYTTEYVIPTLKSKRFVKVLERGKFTLLHHVYKIITEDGAATYGTEASKVFQDEFEFFIAVDDKVFLLKNKEKDLQQIFGMDTYKAISFIKSERTNFKNSEDLKFLIQQMNK